MNLWIRSQDGRELQCAKNIYLSESCSDGMWHLYVDGSNMYECFGEPTAMKVLDEVVRRMGEPYEYYPETIIDGELIYRAGIEQTRIIDLRVVEKAVLGEGSGDE